MPARSGDSSRKAGRSGEQRAFVALADLFSQRAVGHRDNAATHAVAFTKFDGVETWNHSRRLLERIAEEALRVELDTLVGTEFLVAVESATEALGDAIGVGRVTPAPSRTALAEAVSRFSSAVGAYARSIAADVSEEDEASVARFLAAVAPIDELRSTRQADDTSDEDVEGGPVPVVTPALPIAPAV